MKNVSTGVLEKIKNIIQEVMIKPKHDMIYQDIYNCICQNTKNSTYTIHYVKPTFYHDVGEISDLSQSEAPNLVMWQVRVMQPTTPSPWRLGRSWPQFNVQENGPRNAIRNILQDKSYQNQLYKEKWYSVGRMTFLIKLVWIYECIKLEFYLKSSTGKSYSNIRLTQGPFVNEDLTVANMWWTVLTYNQSAILHFASNI